MNAKTTNKNIVICCDGTSNEFGDHNSNVVKLYQLLRRNGTDQLAYYDPGVGTISSYQSLTRLGRKFKSLLGLGFGLGLTKDIQDAYWFLMQNYDPGDRIFLFGFSRGAYTVRAIAAMLHKCGLLYDDNVNLIPEATRIFKTFGNAEIAKSFKETFSRSCDVHFLGLWDTVTSVGRIWDPARLPCTSANSSVAIVRHAISIDERRAFFRQNLWIGRPKSTAQHDPRYVQCHDPHDPREQDVKQVWFAGQHGDVGGGYTPQESDLSQIALEWMLVQGTEQGLEIDESIAATVLNSPPPNHKLTSQHSSYFHHSLSWPMRALWCLCEVYPKFVAVPPNRGLSLTPRNENGWGKKPRLNRARPRFIKPNAKLHASVQRRLQDVPDYRPKNLPFKTSPNGVPNIPENAIEPWSRLLNVDVAPPQDIVRIEARRWSVRTPFHLQTGKHYRFSAFGTWIDWTHECTATGFATEEVKPSSRKWLRLSEKWRRYRDANWFSVIGRINDRPEFQFDIGKLIESEKPYEAQATGTLYCFANDLVCMYWNNRGAITLRIESCD